MLEFFRLAEANRNQEFKNIPLHVLMEGAAEEAGWHLEYVPNLQNKTKYQVRYDRPFSSEVTAELACRLRPVIMKFLSKREIDPLTIDSFVGYGFFNFIKTYKPKVHDTDEKIMAAVYRSVMNKVDQLNRKEIFRYRPTNDSLRSMAGEEVVDENGNRRSVKYVRTPKEVSLSTPVYGKDGEEDSEIGNFIPDSYTPEDAYLDKEGEEDLVEEFGATTDIKKVIIETLVEAGGHGKMTLKELKVTVAIKCKPEVESLYDEFEILIKSGKKDEADKYEKEVIHPQVSSIDRQVKNFYRELKKRLAAKVRG